MGGNAAATPSPADQSPELGAGSGEALPEGDESCEAPAAAAKTRRVRLTKKTTPKQRVDTSKMTMEQKRATPCMHFFELRKCRFEGECFFSHTPPPPPLLSSKSKADGKPSPPPPKGKAKAKGKAGATPALPQGLNGPTGADGCRLRSLGAGVSTSGMVAIPSASGEGGWLSPPPPQAQHQRVEDEDGTAASRCVAALPARPRRPKDAGQGGGLTPQGRSPSNGSTTRVQGGTSVALSTSASSSASTPKR